MSHPQWPGLLREPRNFTVVVIERCGWDGRAPPKERDSGNTPLTQFQPPGQARRLPYAAGGFAVKVGQRVPPVRDKGIVLANLTF